MDNQHCVKDNLRKKNTVPKVIAFYLPQYHEIPENNKWWGKGFTEWTNVKRAKKIFDGQYQPQVPLNNNYYNLLDRKTVEWQTDLAKRYGVYGFCYFYYNFGTKKLLEKPVENLLKWESIPQQFCFAWANVTWARTWKAVEGQPVTVWEHADMEGDDDNGVLIQQSYGEIEDWKVHINYLMNFFVDSRYIKKDGKPLFLIYDLKNIPKAKEMFKVWNEIVKGRGFPGIHIISLNQMFVDNPYVEAIAHYGLGVGRSRSTMARLIERVRSLKSRFIRLVHADYNAPNIWDYEFMWKAMLKVQPYGNVINYPGAFVNYDDTPRHGKYGTFLKDSSPAIFQKYMAIQLKRAREVYQSEYVFLDAWNEWGEGNHLEPDEKDGYGYLEALAQAIDAAGRG